MSDVSQGYGWWEAKDGKWYPPERHPDYKAPTQVAAPIVPTAQPAQTRSGSAHQKPVVSRQAEPSAFSSRVAAIGPLPGSVQGWKPVRRKRIDDSLAQRQGAFAGLAIAAASWVLIPGLQYLGNRTEGDEYFSYNLGFFILSNASVGPVAAALFVIAGLCIAALVAGWLVARAATNSRAGLSAGAASGSVFVASLVIPVLTLIFVRMGLPPLERGDLFSSVLQIVIYAGLYAIAALPFGILGWLIGRPQPLSVAATASLNLNQTAASDELTLVLSGLSNQRVERPSISTVSLRLKFFPGWAIVLGVMLFPLGVLAVIAAQREETGTIILNEAGQDTSTLQVRGTFDEAACTRIEAFLKQHAAGKELA